MFTEPQPATVMGMKGVFADLQPGLMIGMKKPLSLKIASRSLWATMDVHDQLKRMKPRENILILSRFITELLANYSAQLHKETLLKRRKKTKLVRRS